MLAIENGHVDTVLYLIANSAIVNARDIQGRTALHRGVSYMSTLLLLSFMIYLHLLAPWSKYLPLFGNNNHTRFYSDVIVTKLRQEDCYKKSL